MAKFKCGHEKTRDNTNPRGRCRECWNAYNRNYYRGITTRPEEMPPPSDLAEMAKTRNKVLLRQHYGVGETRLNKWLAETGVKAAKILIRHRHMPDDFAELAPTMSQRALALHYKVDWSTVRRWKEESGVETLAPMVARFQSLQQNNRLPSHSFSFKGSASIPVVRDNRAFTIYDAAADVLRKYAACFRCDERGRADLKGNMWRLGNIIVSPDELLDRAERKRERAA